MLLHKLVGRRRYCPLFLGHENRSKFICLLRNKGCFDTRNAEGHLRSISNSVCFGSGLLDVGSRGPRPNNLKLTRKDSSLVEKANLSFSTSHLQATDQRSSFIETFIFNEDLEMASKPEKISLENLNFDNKVVKDLPVDEKVDPRVQRQVPGACFTSAHQEPLENPETVAVSPSALDLLDISESEATRIEFSEYFSGSKLLPGSKPAAHCYCGHQFGYFSGQLGDGAAM